MVTAYRIPLPFDRPPLSLNDRGETPGARAVKSIKVAMVRNAVKVAAQAAQIPPLDAIHVRLHYQPKDRRRRDSDNLVGTLKPCLDGLVSAGVVPDDCDPFVDWSRPKIHPPADDRRPAMWLVVTPIQLGEAA